MTINFDWYTTNYRYRAVYAILIVKATVYNKAFTFNWSLKIGRLYVFKISGTFSYLLGQSIKIRDCPGQSGTYCKFVRRQNFRLDQIETNCRRHFEMHLK